MKLSTLLLTLLLAGVLRAHGALRLTRQPSDDGGSKSDTLSFHCAAEGDADTLKVEWQFKDVIVTQNTSSLLLTSRRSVLGGDSASIESTLTVRDIKVSDTGRIMCLASDSSSVVKASRKVVLNVHYINGDFKVSPSFVGVASGSQPNLEVGQRVVLQCHPPFAFPKATVVWHRNNKPVQLDNRVHVSVLVSDMSQLTFNQIVPADNGTYTCHASNVAGLMVSRGTLDVKPIVPLGSFPSVMYISPVDVMTVVAPASAKFTCHAFSRPEPDTVTWQTRKGAIINSNNKFMAEQRTLTVHSNGAGKSRLAVCHANTSTTNVERTLTVYSANAIAPNALGDKTVPETGIVLLNCTVPEKYYPDPTFEWYGPDGQRIQPGGRQVIVSGARYSALEIDPTYLADGGVYSCNATNSLLSQTTSVTSKVTVTPSQREIRTQRASLVVDVKVVSRMPCEVLNGGQLLPVTWLHKRREINVGRQPRGSCGGCRVYVETDGTLVFNLPQEIDYGIWTCFNEETDYSVINVTVTGRPYFTVKPEEQLEVSVGQIVQIVCAANGIPPPKVKWQSKNTPARNFTGGESAVYNSTMTINVSSDYHGAEFQCVAGNRLGLIFTSVRLAVVRNDPNNGNRGGSSSDNSIIVTIAIVIPCAVLYIAAMVLLVLWCQKRRYRLHRMSKESSEAEAEGEEGEISGREMESMPKKDALEPVAEDPPPNYKSGTAGVDAATASGPEEIGVKSEAPPVAEEETHEPVRSKPPAAHQDGEEPVRVERPESPTVTATPIIFRAAEPHGIPHSSLKELPRFKRDQCKVKKHLGRGYFTTYADVSNRFSGAAADTSMMLTKYKASAQDSDGYTRDILCLTSLRHKNIASCIAVSAEKHPFCILSEYYPQGDLKQLLLQRDDEADLHLQYHHQLSVLLQLCDALQYLSARRFVHRDVATHSCIINSSFQVKLAFYSRSMEGYPDDYYTDDEDKEPLPVRWMSPESLQSKEFTIQNDAWSFGVLMWEIFASGEQPYADVGSEVIAEHVAGGARLEKPEGCPEAAFKTMRMCWEQQAKDRPHFSQLATRLHQLSSTSDL